MCINSESVFNNAKKKTTNAKKISKINVTKNALFFLSRALTHHSFIKSRFLYELKHRVNLSKTVIFYFRFRLIFTKVDISVQQKACTV